MSWDWNSRGRAVEEARRACVPSSKRGYAEAATAFRQAVANAWPPGFFEDLERCKRGERGGLEEVLSFVEACPRFFRSGYILTRALRWLPRPPRSAQQTARMRMIVLGSVARQLRVPFARIPSLARAVDSPDLRGELLRLEGGADEKISARAVRVLDGLPLPSWDPDRLRAHRADRRALSMLVTAKRERSAELLRRLFALEVAGLTGQGRRSVAVGFEFAMNWGLLPDEELLAVAKRIDSPEMADIWGYARRREDAAGERARWLLERLR